jgi:S1-C subfamily serine protease
MTYRVKAALVAASLILLPGLAHRVRAENPMGYQLLSQEDAANLPHNHGALGLDIERARQLTDSGMTFDIIRVKQVWQGSAGAQAGLRAGDQIIAVDGHVFPTLAAFSNYVGSISPGRQMTVDYMPPGGGPQQAQRVTVTAGRAP